MVNYPEISVGILTSLAGASTTILVVSQEVSYWIFSLGIIGGVMSFIVSIIIITSSLTEEEKPRW